MDLPHVGAVRLWFADTAEHGWCAGLRLPSGAWVGTGRDRLDAGGTVPGCMPTRSQVNAAGQPVYVLGGFDYEEGDVDARSAGGSFWRIRYGLLAAPAVRVTDLRHRAQRASWGAARVRPGHPGSEPVRADTGPPGGL